MTPWWTPLLINLVWLTTLSQLICHLFSWSVVWVTYVFLNMFDHGANVSTIHGAPIPKFREAFPLTLGKSPHSSCPISLAKSCCFLLLISRMSLFCHEDDIDSNLSGSFDLDGLTIVISVFYRGSCCQNNTNMT